MLHLKNLTKHYGGRTILDRVDWHLRPTDRVGLCGENGAGKTTLLRMIGGVVEADTGTIQTTKGATIGYLPQDGLEHAGQSLFTEVRSAVGELLTMEAELTRLEGEIATSHRPEDMERYANLQEEFRFRGGYEIEAEIGRVLRGLGFTEADHARPCETFSGGWQMRIALAKLLLQRPTLLLLDEPTNHLDLPARDWLEGYLITYPHAVMLVSHDRFFLDQVVTRIVEVWNGGLTEYPGNYSSYLTERERRVTALRDAKEKQDEEIERIEAFINRFRFQANKASQVQSRVKQLEKIERIAIPPARKAIAFRFPEPPKGGKSAMELHGVSHGYGDLEVLRNIELSVERGERIALVGANGAGKSTLMRLLSGTEAPRSGERKEGHNLALAYFAQDQAKVLDAKKSVLGQITEAAPFDMVPKVRNILGAFLFSGDDVEKKVSVLSGGERNRLALAMLLLKPANLLLLDEPTNHLDLQSKEVLLDSLRSYSGTLIFVSHDRYFVDSLATRIILVGNGRAESHLGNYSDFLARLEGAEQAGHSTLRVEQKLSGTTGTTPDEGKGKQIYERSKEEKRLRRKYEREVATLEEQIAIKEGELAELTEEMAAPAFAAALSRWDEAQRAYDGLQECIAGLYKEWEILQERLAEGEA